MYMYLSIYIYIQNCKAMWQLLWQLMHLCNCYKLLVPMNKRVFNKLSKEWNISGHT